MINYIFLSRPLYILLIVLMEVEGPNVDDAWTAFDTPRNAEQKRKIWKKPANNR